VAARATPSKLGFGNNQGEKPGLGLCTAFLGVITQPGYDKSLLWGYFELIVKYL
jgi:hypothetical protein